MHRIGGLEKRWKNQAKQAGIIHRIGGLENKDTACCRASVIHRIGGLEKLGFDNFHTNGK